VWIYELMACEGRLGSLSGKGDGEWWVGILEGEREREVRPGTGSEVTWGGAGDGGGER
jgi:hypothetical protein